MIASSTHKGINQYGATYGVREGVVIVWMETYQGERVKDRIMAAIASLPAEHSLKKADEVGRKKVENLFKALGFKVVAVTVVEVPEVKVIAPEVSATVENESVENMDTAAIL